MLKRKYALSSTHRFTQHLREIKLKDYVTVHEYEFEIDDTIKRVQIHKKYSQNELKRIHDDSFLCGIENLILTKFISDGISDAMTVFERIFKTEKFIISKIPKKNEKHTRHEFPKQHNTSKRYCLLHKTRTHSNEECLTQGKNHEKAKKKFSNYVLPYIYMYLIMTTF
ncbi:hypothetical protein DMUE_4294 [Dictyocoela muelleri]|nr:hypothetical protein DMUE_4294 [Dictyocoela muelleri]